MTQQVHPPGPVDRTLLNDSNPASDDGDTFARSRRGGLLLFHEAVARVPAYQDFLRRQDFDPQSVQTDADFARVPVMDKACYLDSYDLDALSWDGDPGAGAIVHSSSGTSGEASYWPCTLEELHAATKLYRHLLVHEFGVGARHHRALLIVCFGMGTWIAGSYTTTCCLLLRSQGLPLSLVTPGFNQAETLSLLRRLAPRFGHIVVAGIPSFIKDLAERWDEERGASAPGLDVLLAGEGFPESWRHHVSSLCGPAGGTVRSLLGSADAGLIGFETADTVALRTLAEKDATLRSMLFQNARVPAVMHFDPSHRYLESLDGRLLVTANRAIPLIRYDTRDVGGVLPPAARAGVDLPGLPSGPGSMLPLVYLFGRGERNATLYGANIYAEYAQELLVHPLVSPFSTGRFRMLTRWLSDHQQRLDVLIELTEAATNDTPAVESWHRIFVELLRRRSSEYSKIYAEFGERAIPRIVPRPFHCPDDFPEIHRKIT